MIRLSAAISMMSRDASSGAATAFISTMTLRPSDDEAPHAGQILTSYHLII